MQKIDLNHIAEQAAARISITTDGQFNVIDATQPVSKREQQLRHAAYAIATVAQIDAEAESAQFREQARALLVAAHHAGQAWLCVSRSGSILLSSINERLDLGNFETDADPAPHDINDLARVLQARKARP